MNKDSTSITAAFDALLEIRFLTVEKVPHAAARQLYAALEECSLTTDVYLRLEEEINAYAGVLQDYAYKKGFADAIVLYHEVDLPA